MVENARGFDMKKFLASSQFWLLTGLVVLTVMTILNLEGVLSMMEWASERGSAAVPLVAFGVILATLLLVPGSLSKAVSGALLGIWWGTLAAFVGAWIGSLLAFLLGRHIISDFSKRLYNSQPYASALNRAVTERGLLVIVMIRLSLFVPYNLANYALGATDMSFKHFSLGSLAMLPMVFVHAWWGSLAGAVLLNTGTGVNPADYPGGWTLTIIGIVVTASLMLLLAKWSGDALREILADTKMAESDE